MLVLVTFTVNAGFNFALGLLVAHFLGPADFGRYAFAQALGVLINVTFLDWVRLSTTRFYSERTRQSEPNTRRTLDLSFGAAALATTAICALCIAAGVRFDLSFGLAAIIPAVAITYAVFDYHAAMTRALFHDRQYATIVISKNVLSLLLMVLGAWYFRDPLIVLAGLCVSQIVAWLSVRNALAEPADEGRGDLRTGRMFMLYALPIVLANMFYQTIPLYNRAAIQDALGFAEMGQYSLAFDLSTKLFSAVGSAFDILLFQLAVRSHNEEGLEAARMKLGQNLGIVIGGIVPLAVGLILVLPSIEATFVPVSFQGAFSGYVAALTPGLAALSIILYGLNPAFQIRNRTYPIIIACVVAIAMNIALVGLLPAGASGVAYAHRQMISLFAALAVTVVFVVFLMPVVPSRRAMAGCASGVGAMVAVLLPMRALAPGLTTLIAMTAAGTLAYLAAQLLVNRRDVRAVLHSRRQVPSASA